MRTLKLTIEYDGTHFFGFQRQKEHRSVQEELEKAFRQFLHEPICVTGAGRTDSGVHALRQVAHIRIQNPLPEAAIRKAVNGILSKDVVVKKVEAASSDFHARYSARGKIYQYFVWNSLIRSPLNEAISYRYPKKLDLEKMKEAGRHLTGKHDFKSFQTSGGKKDMATVRNLSALKISKKGSLISFTFEGDGFLYNMVRNIVGTLIWVGEGRLTPFDIPQILKARDRRKAGPTAPAQGLFLIKVKY
ncbi:MAG: tRNA pseudouridine(38-40) synthase TruA [Candidatus Omnitrophica bacterium]|nr:tRNA pseudouridine(38-40) synthase TruA [Candidatus Omnitrophota bacterium]